MSRPIRIAVAVLVVVGAATACGGDPDRSAAPVPARADASVDIISIVLDDASAEMVRAMPNVDALLRDAGTDFTDAAVSVPLCCPSRATLVTGAYAHNHGVLDNVAPAGGHDKLPWGDTVATRLSAAGYRTAHVGRTLNDYTPTTRQGVPVCASTTSAGLRRVRSATSSRSAPS